MGSPLDELERAAAGVGPPPPAMAPYLVRVRERAYTITDAEIEQLRAAGLSEDAIFEQTVAAAVGEGLRRLAAARRALA